MRKIWLLLLILMTGLAFSQTYEATIQQIIDGSNLYVDLYLETTSGTSDILGDHTLVINFNTAALTYVGKVAAFDGRWDNDNSSDYNDLTSAEGTGTASLDGTKASGTGLDIPESATRVGRIQFSIDDAGANSGISWNTSALTSVYDWAGSSIKSDVTFTDPGDFSLPVEMTNIVASADPKEGIVIQWVTASEVNCAGFHVYRSDDETGGYIRLTDQMIPAQGNSSSAAEYHFADKLVKSGVLYWYKIEEIATTGESTFYGPVAVQGIAMVPSAYRLSQNYPNPFNPVTYFEYDLAQAEQVKIEVYNMLGKHVRTLVNTHQQAGYYTSQWNGLNESGQRASSGIYFIRIEAGQFTQVRKIALQR